MRTANKIESLNYYKVHFPGAQSAVSHDDAYEHKLKLREQLKQRGKMRKISPGADLPNKGNLNECIEMQKSERGCKSEFNMKKSNSKSHLQAESSPLLAGRQDSKYGGIKKHNTFKEQQQQANVVNAM